MRYCDATFSWCRSRTVLVSRLQFLGCVDRKVSKITERNECNENISMYGCNNIFIKFSYISFHIRCTCIFVINVLLIDIVTTYVSGQMPFTHNCFFKLNQIY